MSKGNPPNPVKGLTQEPKKYFWLVTGDVYFSKAESPEGIQTAQMNSILSTVAPAVNSQALGNAQAGLTQRLKDTDPEMDFQVHNVVFHAISPLGQMTDKEFFGEQTVAQGRPAGA